MTPLMNPKEEKFKGKLKIQPPSGKDARPNLISSAEKKSGELLAPLDYFFLGGIFVFSLLSLILAVSA